MVSGLSCLSCFFFKQKTAYEMRISDWSSDVCSSDLVEHPFDVLAIFDQLELIRDQLADLAIDAPDRLVDRADRALLFVTQAQLVVVEQAGLLQHLERQGGDQIGRAHV